MADDLKRHIANCEKRMTVIRTLIEEQRASGVATENAERVLALETSFLKLLQDRLAAEGPNDC